MVSSQNLVLSIYKDDEDKKTAEDVFKDPPHYVYYIGQYKGISFVVKRGFIGLVAYLNIEHLEEYDIELPVEVNYNGTGIPVTLEGGEWSGWDYSHSTDYSPLLDFLGIFTDAIKWTPLMVKNQCLEIIDLISRED